MFFFTLAGCKSNSIEIISTNQIVLSDNLQSFEFEIKTTFEDLILVKVENNDKFEYELIQTDNGYKLNLILFSPKTFSNLTFKTKDQEYICNIGHIEVLTKQLSNIDYINIVIDDNEIYIYNKLDKYIEIEEIKVYGGDYLQSINYSKFIDPKKLTYLGNVYYMYDVYVLYIQFTYNNQIYEQYFQIKNLTNF